MRVHSVQKLLNKEWNVEIQDAFTLQLGVMIFMKGYTSTNESLTVLKGTSMPG
jgi:hypothetical protein